MILGPNQLTIDHFKSELRKVFQVKAKPEAVYVTLKMIAPLTQAPEQPLIHYIQRRKRTVHFEKENEQPPVTQPPPEPSNTTPGAERIPFMLIFESSELKILEPNIYDLVSQTGLEVSFFMEPVHTTKPGVQRYRVIVQ